eukprot:RCo035542
MSATGMEALMLLIPHHGAKGAPGLPEQPQSSRGAPHCATGVGRAVHPHPRVWAPVLAKVWVRHPLRQLPGVVLTAHPSPFAEPLGLAVLLLHTQAWIPVTEVPHGCPCNPSKCLREGVGVSALSAAWRPVRHSRRPQLHMPGRRPAVHVAQPQVNHRMAQLLCSPQALPNHPLRNPRGPEHGRREVAVVLKHNTPIALFDARIRSNSIVRRNVRHCHRSRPPRVRVQPGKGLQGAGPKLTEEGGLHQRQAGAHVKRGVAYRGQPTLGGQPAHPAPPRAVVVINHVGVDNPQFHPKRTRGRALRGSGGDGVSLLGNIDPLPRKKVQQNYKNHKRGSSQAIRPHAVQGAKK